MANFTIASLTCSKDDNMSRGRCCRYINEFVAVSVALYAKETGNLGVTSEFSSICIQSLIDTFESHGIPPKVATLCALGTKIRVHYECHNQSTVRQMMEFLTVEKAAEKCTVPLSLESNCRECKNASISRIWGSRNVQDNLTLGICRDAIFVTIASQLSDITNVAGCFYGVQGLRIPTTVVSQPPQASFFHEAPTISPGMSISLHINPHKQHHTYGLTLILIIGLVVTSLSLVLLIPLALLIRSKNRHLFDSYDKSPAVGAEGASLVRKFLYEELRAATSDFRVVIGEGGFGTVYKAKFRDGSVMAVKKMKKVSVLAENEFYREMEFLAKLHHRHLVTLLGFCAEGERFLVYEYLENGSLKDHLHSENKDPLSWETRIQIAIDVANALEYLHFYCNPPLCHRDVKSSNILLGENFVAKLADFGFARTTTRVHDPDTMDSGIWGTPGYIDPYYVATKELSEKSDVYSYGVLLLEIVTGKAAIHERRNLVESFQPIINTDTRLHEIVDPVIASGVDHRQLRIVVGQVKLCTQGDPRFRPSIKQVLRALWEMKEPGSAPVDHLEKGGSAPADHLEKGPEENTRIQVAEVNSSGSESWWVPHSSSTATSYCSRGVQLEIGSPNSPYF